MIKRLKNKINDKVLEALVPLQNRNAWAGDGAESDGAKGAFSLTTVILFIILGLVIVTMVVGAILTATGKLQTVLNKIAALTPAIP